MIHRKIKTRDFYKDSNKRIRFLILRNDFILKIIKLRFNNFYKLGSGCDSVYRAVTFYTRGLGLESSHWLILITYLLLAVERTKGKKEQRMAHLKNINVLFTLS